MGQAVKGHGKRFVAMTESLVTSIHRYLIPCLGSTIAALQENRLFSFFDYWDWKEQQVDQVLKGQLRLAIDTPTTWRIGDGTAGFYNYVYNTVAGFSEHDTFRSNP